MIRSVLLAVGVLVGALTNVARAAQVVHVGGYDFPPFVEDSGGAVKGLAIDLIEALNQAQSAYEFHFVATSARRRYIDVTDGRIDLMFFESPDWEWQARGYPVEFSNVFLKGGEVYIARAKPGRGQEWFDDLKGKRLIGILGYHYGFANMEADPRALTAHWDIKLVNNHRSSIEMILADRMDVAVVTDAYLWGYLSRNPDARDRLLISTRFDQRYNHRALLRKGAPLDTAALNGLLARLEKDGTLDRIWKAAGLR